MSLGDLSTPGAAPRANVLCVNLVKCLPLFTSPICLCVLFYNGGFILIFFVCLLGYIFILHATILPLCAVLFVVTFNPQQTIASSLILD